MSFQRRLVFSTAFIVLMLCFASLSVRNSGLTRHDHIRKNDIVKQIAAFVGEENGRLGDDDLTTIAQIVYEESQKKHLDYRLVLAIMKVESNFRHDAISRKGARGLLQVKPSLAKHIARDAGIDWEDDTTLDEPAKNIRIGVHHFSRLLKDFENINLALHAYHVGPTRLREIVADRKTPEKRYLNLVLDEYDRNKSILPPP